MVSAKALILAHKKKISDKRMNRAENQSNASHPNLVPQSNDNNAVDNSIQVPKQSSRPLKSNNKSKIRLVKIKETGKDLSKYKNTKVDNSTFVKALEELNSLKRKREDEEFGNLHKRVKDSSTVDPEYTAEFFSNLFSNQSTSTSESTISKEHIADQIKLLNRIYFDGDAFVSTFTKKIPETVVPTLENAIYFALQKWMEENNRSEDKIIFRSSVILSGHILSEYPSTMPNNCAAVVMSQYEIPSELLKHVKVIRVSDFISREKFYGQVQNILSTLKSDSNSLTGIDKAEASMIQRMHNYLRPAMQAREFMIQVEGSIIVYDATNLIKKIGNLRKIPTDLFYWCIYNLVRLFGLKYKAKKTYFISDYNPLLKLENPFIYTSSIEVLWERDRKADEVIVDLCKSLHGKENIVLVTDDQELSWRAPGVVECKADAWRQAALSIFHYKYQNPNDVIDKTIHDVLLWYLHEDESQPCGSWSFKRFESLNDRGWMTTNIQKVLSNSS